MDEEKNVTATVQMLFLSELGGECTPTDVYVTGTGHPTIIWV